MRTGKTPTRSKIDTLDSRTKKQWQKVYHIAALLILLLGATLRLAAFDETLIEPDQGSILDAAFHIAHFRYFPLTGMKSSVGVMQTGVIPLLAAIPLFVVKRIIAVQWFFSALDLLALAWLYRAVYRTIGKRAALVTALLYATAPWIILYARTIWYQTLIAGFSTVAFSSLMFIHTPKYAKPYHLPVTLISITMLSLVHLAAAPWGVIVFVYCIVIAWRRRQWRACLLGLGISGIITLPYLIYLSHTSFSDVAFILTASQTGSTVNTAAYRLTTELIAGSSVIANAHGDLWDRSIIKWPTASTAILSLLALALIWALVALIKRPDRRPQLLLTLVWLGAIPTLFLRSNVHLQHFYLMTVFPAPFVLLGAWLGDVTVRPSGAPFHTLRSVVTYVATGLVLVISLWWSSLWIVRIELEANGLLERQTRGWLMDQAGQRVDAYLNHNPSAQVVILADFGGEGSVFDWIIGYTQSQRVRIVPVNKGFLIPEQPTCYLIGPKVPETVLEPVISNVSLGYEDDPIDSHPWPLYCGNPIKSVDRSEPVASWENGMYLLATDTSESLNPGEPFLITHIWQVRALDPRPYHFYNHLLNGEELVSQIDDSSVPFWHWRDGDVLITHFSLPVPEALEPGLYTLQFGMYTWPEIQRVRLRAGSDGHQIAFEAVDETGRQ
jgi:hypothetical protein